MATTAGASGVAAGGIAESSVPSSQTKQFGPTENRELGTDSLPKPKLVPLHIHPRPAKNNPLHAQPEFLFCAVFSAQFNGPARADYTMPRQSRNLPQNAHHLARRPIPARGSRDRSITRHLPLWQSANAAHDAGTLVLRRAIRRFGLSSPIHSSRFTLDNALPVNIYRALVLP